MAKDPKGTSKFYKCKWLRQNLRKNGKWLKTPKKINAEQPEHDKNNYVITNLIYSVLDGEFLHFCLFKIKSR